MSYIDYINKRPIIVLLSITIFFIIHYYIIQLILNHTLKTKEFELKEQIGEQKVIVENLKKNLKYDLSHLTQTTVFQVGPIQDDEALMLFGMYRVYYYFLIHIISSNYSVLGLVKLIRPKTIVEFGFYVGDSSINFLKALDPDAKMYSFDIELRNPNARSLTDLRFKFIKKSQTDFDPTDVDNRTIDIAYLDDGHQFSLQTGLFPKLIKQVSKNGIIVIHDTGLHIYMNSIQIEKDCVCDFENLCGIQHAVGERQFVNWILENYPEWEVINFHSFEVHRHGLTFLQRKYKFGLESVGKQKCKNKYTKQ